MGNAGSGAIPKERQKSGENPPSSPFKDEQAFTFGQNQEPKQLVPQGSQEEEEPYFTKPAAARDIPFSPQRVRSNTVSEGTKIPESDKTPTVFRWEGKFFTL